MTATTALIELIVRLGTELDFDVALDVEGTREQSVPIVWLDRRLPLAAVAADPLDLRSSPVLPIAAFHIVFASTFDFAELDAIAARLESTGAPLRVVVIGRDARASSLAPMLQSVDSMRERDGEILLHTQLTDAFASRMSPHGRTIVMQQQELIDWARHLRDVKPRSYSAESLYRRTGVID